VLALPRALAARSYEPLFERLAPENALSPALADEEPRVELTTFAPVRASVVCL
jgi:hypothetical protein